MSYRKLAGGGKRDAVEREIVQGLRSIGVQVWRLSGKGNPDLLTLYRGRYLPMEVKVLRGRVTANQRDIPWPIVRSFEDALLVLGVHKVIFGVTGQPPIATGRH